MTVYESITHAVLDGINLKHLLIASGLDQHTFFQYHRDMLFSSEQTDQIKRVIREWRVGL